MTEQQHEPDSPPQPESTPGGLGAWLFGGLVGAVMVGLLVAAWVAGKDEGRREAEKPAAQSAPATAPQAAASGPGKQLFAAKCGSCHTLKDAGATAKVGPDLNDLQPDAALVLDAIKNGGAGSGTMPRLIYQGEEAQQVADYVAAAAGGG